MRLDVSAELESLINKRLSTGAYADVEDVLRCALEAQDAGDAVGAAEHAEWKARIENGYQQALHGDVLNVEQAKREIHAAKLDWLQSRR
ncbi:MAG: hypothetical protein IT162_02615 [Bryobacterales bacterium]|nr:hypothetical protein [Bryobacterales bacterium]